MLDCLLDYIYIIDAEKCANACVIQWQQQDHSLLLIGGVARMWCCAESLYFMVLNISRNYNADC